jgi:DNA polymerase III gamma/tau subunit
MVAVDPARAGEGDLAEGEIERLTALAKQFSREDLMRAFDLLAKAEQDIRMASHPRYHIEMLLLRWMHLRKLVPLMELLEGGGGGAPVRKLTPPAATAKLGVTKSSLAPASDTVAPTRNIVAPASSKLAPTSSAPPGDKPAPASDTIAPGGLKDKFLAEIRSTKNTLYSLAVAQAQRIDVTDERISFTFASNQNVAKMQLDSNREWLEGLAQKLTGRRIQVTSVQVQSDAAPAASAAPSAASSAPKRDLKEEAKSSPAVQAMLEVFPAEIRDVEEF